ncbi:MAG: NAD(P)-dependent oxidoreductase [Gammaproteobacteria bacterium]|nr:NAD(P)-dependent oxidoreductase [Gammaproteobacteria bacterium]
MKKLRVGLSRRFRNADGSPAIPEFDMSPLVDDPRIECVELPEKSALAVSDLESLDAVLLGLETIDRASFAETNRLVLAARFGVGYDRIDVDACTANAVALAITPDGVRRAVAVAVITFMLALTTKLVRKDRMVRDGPAAWARKAEHNGFGLEGRVLGSLGIGNIGAEVFRLARPFGMRHIAHDPFAAEETFAALDVAPVPLEQLFAEADVLTVNCPLTEHTRGIVDEKNLRRMKPSAYLINTARGPIVDQRALARALADGVIAGAGLDVFETEPVDAGDPILAADNVLLAPHALAWTDQSMAAIGAADVRAVHAVMRGEPPEFVVNRAVLDDERFREKLRAVARRLG